MATNVAPADEQKPFCQGKQRVKSSDTKVKKEGIKIELFKEQQNETFGTKDKPIAIEEDESLSEEQQKKASDAKAMMDAIEKELSKILGLDKLKIQLRKWFKGMVLDENRRAVGLSLGPKRLPQLAFLGNPGTGKTMVARVLGKLLHMVGILPNDKVIEVQRTDLVGQYIGQTGPQTRKKIEEAEGGILFVDEAYRLVPEKVSHNDLGIEALEEIMSSMDKGKIVVIFAGYKDPMKRVLSSNQGMRRRVSNLFHFDDFSCEQLAKLVHFKLNSKDENSHFFGFKLHHKGTSEKDIAALIKKGTTSAQRKKMNGGLVDQMLVRARESLDSRIEVGCTDRFSMVTITSEDIAVGLKSLKDEEKSDNKGSKKRGRET